MRRGQCPAAGIDNDPAWGCKALPLFRFVDDFYGPHLGVIHFRRERKQQLALAVGTQPVEFADYRPERPSGCLKDIEIRKQHDAIAGDIEDSAAHSPAAGAGNYRAEERLEEVELNSVASRCNRDGVAEIAISLSAVKSGDLRSWLGISNKGDPPLDEVILPAPARAVAICEIRSMSGKPDRLQPSRRTRVQFQRTHECRPSPTRKKLQVKLAVRRWVHIPKNAYVNRSGTGVGSRIEVQQQRMSVQVDLEMAGILGDLPLVHIGLPQGIGEIEPQLVNT